MSKVTTQFSCSSCSYKSVKWLGCCPTCNAWDTLIEDAPITKKSLAQKAINMHTLQDIDIQPHQRMIAHIPEWDRVMGGGIMPHSLIMLTGDPGIGKSTLLLQVCHALSQHHRVFYFSTEESLEQVKQRAERITNAHNNLLFSDNVSLDAIIETTLQEKPAIIVIDSIQNCTTSAHTLPGSINQLKEATFQLLRLAKEHHTTIILTGHITKEGVMAGPKTLEHMVDAVFYLQGEDRYETRVLRAVKNRFGTINELGFFSMSSEGMQEVTNINAHVVSEYTHAPGSCLVCTMEGSRPLLVELQALTIESKLAMPQRVISGLDHKQVILIAAILQKYAYIKLNTQDIFCKVSGGITLKDSTTDLGIALALLSSYFQQPIAPNTLALGEISLTGHVKPINNINLFLREAEKFGINHIIISKKQKITVTNNITVTAIQNVGELLTVFNE